MKRFSMWLIAGLLLFSIGCKPYFGNVEITSTADLDNWAGYTHIFGSLNIKNADSADIEALNTVEAVYGNLTVKYSDWLGTLEGLRNLETVGFNLEIIDNSVLFFLDLDSLSRVGGNFEISGNNQLRTFKAIDLRDQVIEREGIGGNVTIVGNCTTILCLGT